MVKVLKSVNLPDASQADAAAPKQNDQSPGSRESPSTSTSAGPRREPVAERTNRKMLLQKALQKQAEPGAQSEEVKKELEKVENKIGILRSEAGNIKKEKERLEKDPEVNKFVGEESKLALALKNAEKDLKDLKREKPDWKNPFQDLKGLVEELKDHQKKQLKSEDVEKISTKLKDLEKVLITLDKIKKKEIELNNLKVKLDNVYNSAQTNPNVNNYISARKALTSAENQFNAAVVWKGLIQELPIRQKGDLQPGDILLRIEEPGESESHRVNVRMQKAPNVNGIQDNKGDPRIVHALIWTKAPNNPGNTEPRGMGEPEVVDARGGIGTVEIRRVQGTALQAGNYKVYRPKDENRGDWSVQIAMMWSDQGNVNYSSATLKKAARYDGELIKFDEKARAAALQVVTDPFTHDPEYAKNPPGIDPLEGNGDVCSSLPVRTYQASEAQVTAAEKREKGEDDNLDKIVAAFTGLMANNPVGVSPMTLEHLLKTGKTADGAQQFEPFGALKVEQDEVLYPEKAFPPKAKL